MDSVTEIITAAETTEAVVGKYVTKTWELS